MRTEILRIPVPGPTPANTLVYLTGAVPGLLVTGASKTTHNELWFKTQFQLDGYQQQHHQKYLDTTKVSCTAMLRHVASDEETTFLIAIDRVEYYLDMDGVLGFKIFYAWRVESGAMVATAVISAYVTFYEMPSVWPGQPPSP